MTYQRLIVERRGPVGWIINDRPDRLNAYDAVMRAGIPQRLGGIERRSRCARDRPYR